MNDNKSTVMNNAAVQQLRKVPGFDPMKLLRFCICSKDRKYFSGASGIKISDKEQPPS